MRAVTLAAITLVIACGSKSPGASGPGADPPPQTIEVASIEPYATGFRYETTVHRSLAATDVAEDASYAVEVLGTDEATGAIAKIRIEFGDMSSTAPGAPTEPPIAHHSYDVAAGDATRSDGTALTEDEVVLLGTFLQQGGLVIPVRDALVGVHLDKDEPVELEPDRLWQLLGLRLEAAIESATVTLRGVDPGGLATLELAADGKVGPDVDSKWTLTGTATVEAATLLPHTFEWTVSYSVSSPQGIEGGEGTTRRTFRYAPPPTAGS